MLSMLKKYQFKKFFGTSFILLLSFNISLAAEKDCRNPLEVTLKENITMKFCEIPEAKGIPIGTKNGIYFEQPVIERDFEQSFHIGQYEVTQIQFKTIMKTSPWKKVDKTLKEDVKEGDNYPAVYVTHTEAKQFAKALSNIDKTATYRLPTEAEWEYAARAGSSTKYYWGESFDANFAFYKGNSRDYNQHAKLVDLCPIPILDEINPGYCANAFGLIHMMGNVSEFTLDIFKWNYEGASTNGHQAMTGPDSEGYICRGGSWDTPSYEMSSAYRFTRIWSNSRSSSHGFRLVRIPKQ